jgi:hypothetical protein
MMKAARRELERQIGERSLNGTGLGVVKKGESALDSIDRAPLRDSRKTIR